MTRKTTAKDNLALLLSARAKLRKANDILAALDAPAGLQATLDQAALRVESLMVAERKSLRSLNGKAQARKLAAVATASDSDTDTGIHEEVETEETETDDIDDTDTDAAELDS